MEQLEFSPKDVQDLLRRIQEIKMHIYKTHPGEAGNDRLLRRYFPENMLKDHSAYQNGMILVSPKGLIIEVSSSHSKPITMKISGKINTTLVLIQEIEQHDTVNPITICQLAPYLNPYLEKLEKLVNSHYDDLDLSHEKKREYLIKQFLQT